MNQVEQVPKVIIHIQECQSNILELRELLLPITSNKPVVTEDSCENSGETDLEQAIISLSHSIKKLKESIIL